MATHDYVIDNSTGANVRADINLVLQAILTNNSSSSAPTTTAHYMWWADTTNGVLKIRNSNNTGWVELFQLDGTLTLEDGTKNAPALAHRSNLNTGIYFSAANKFNVATAGVDRMELASTGTVFNNEAADVDFRIESDDNTHMFFIDAGNNRIGINEDSPETMLHISNGDANDGPIILIEGSGQNAANNLLGGINFKNLDSSGDGPTITGAIRHKTANSSGNGGYLTFHTHDGTEGGEGSDAPERVRIDAAGNVGIGSTSPSVTLDIEATTPTIRLTDSDASGTPECEIKGGGGDLIFSADRDDEKTSTVMQFQTDGSTAMTIDSSQQLGIGTTSPAAKLHVMDGDLFLTDNSTATNSGQAVYFQSTTNGWAKGSAHCVIHGLRGANSSGIIRFDTRRDSSTDERMRLNENGQLLIGTTSASNTNGTGMEIFRSDNTVYSKTSNRVHGLVITNDSDVDGGFAGIELRASDGDGYVGSSLLKTIADGTNFSNDFVIQTRHGGNYNERFRINSSGEIGVDTSSPDHLLSVKAANSNTPRIGITNPDNDENFNISTYHDSNGIYVGIGANAKYNSSGNLAVDTTAHKSAMVELDARFGGAVRCYTGGSGGTPTEALVVDSNQRVRIGANDFDGTGASDTAMTKIASTSSEEFALGIVERGGQGIGISCRIDGAGSGTTAINFMDGPTLVSVGTITCNSTSTAYNQSGSDRTLKKNFENWTDTVLTSFKNLNPQKFNFIHEDDTADKHKGYIAQDLVADFPEAYPKSPDTEKYMYNPSGMVVYLMKAIQELEAKVAALEAA